MCQKAEVSLKQRWVNQCDNSDNSRTQEKLFSMNAHTFEESRRVMPLLRLCYAEEFGQLDCRGYRKLGHRSP